MIGEIMGLERKLNGQVVPQYAEIKAISPGTKTGRSAFSEIIQRVASENSPPPPPQPHSNFFQRHWKELLISAVALAGIGIAAKIVNEQKTETIPITETFDSQAMESYVEPSNIAEMSVNEYEKIAPPLWEEQNKTLTIPLPITFRDNRDPTLHIEKSENWAIPNYINTMTIDGLEQGDTIFSPIDGEITFFDVKETGGKLASFSLKSKGPQGERIDLTFATTDVKFLIDYTNQSTTDKVTIPIKKGTPIGTLITGNKHRMFDGQIQIYGNGPLLKYFNLAITAGGKVIVLR
jgi:hypothetical protein